MQDNEIDETTTNQAPEGVQELEELPEDDLSGEATEMVDVEAENAGETAEESGDPETFPREYVQELRQENARYRAQAKTAEGLAQRLHVALVAATGRLADPTDLPFDQAHLEDPEALAAAVDELLAGKPHLKSRKVTGDIGQGTRTSAPADVDLLGLLRGRAG